MTRGWEIPRAVVQLQLPQQVISLHQSCGEALTYFHLRGEKETGWEGFRRHPLPLCLFQEKGKEKPWKSFGGLPSTSSGPGKPGQAQPHSAASCPHQRLHWEALMVLAHHILTNWVFKILTGLLWEQRPAELISLSSSSRTLWDRGQRLLSDKTWATSRLGSSSLR